MTAPVWRILAAAWIVVALRRQAERCARGGYRRCWWCGVAYPRNPLCDIVAKSSAEGVHHA